MRRWLGSTRVRLIAIVTAVALVAGTATTIWWLNRDDPDRRTVWDQVMAMVEEDGSVGLDMAKAAFSLTYTELPGVTLPDGPEGPARSGTPAANWILEHWNELTAEEQDIVADVLALQWDRPQAGALRLVSASEPRQPSDCEPTDELKLRNPPGDYLQMVYDTASAIEALIGVTLDATITVCISENQPGGDHKNAFAATGTQFDPDGSMRCRVVFYPLGQRETGASLRSIAAHELTHCFNRRNAKHRANSDGRVFIPSWIDEGLCNWVAYKIAGAVKNLDDWWGVYLNNLRRPLVERSYDAFGFFQHIDNIRGDMAATVQRTAGAQGEDFSLAAFMAATENHRHEVLSTLPSSWANEPGWGVPVLNADAWFLNGPGLTTFRPPLGSYTLVSDGDPVVAAAAPYGIELVRVLMQADVFLINRSEHAVGRFSPDKGTDYDLLVATMDIFCAEKGGCKCPDGTTPSVPFTRVTGGSYAYLAVTGGAAPARVEAVGYSLERFCKERPKPQSRPLPDEPAGAPVIGGGGGCQGTCGGSDRDPHLNTFDGLYYDLQSVGEYTLVAATNDDLEVQARTAPVHGSTTASVNVAIALRVAGDRVGVYLQPGGGAEVRVNGAVTQVDAEQALPGGGKLNYVERNYTVTWPDGTQAWIIPLGEKVPSLTFQMSPADSRKAKLTGLLGDFDGNQANDLRLRDGTVVTNPSFEQLHTTVVDSWRVTGVSSLFDYGPGENTATFTDLTFPSGPVTAENSPNREAAEAACRAAGVTDPVQLANCIVDVGVTGDDAYAAIAASMQRFLSRSVGPGQKVTDGAFAGGEITSAGQKDRFPLDLGGATVFFIADWAGPTLGCDQALSISLLGVTSDHRPCSDQAVRLRVPDPAASYQLEVAGVGDQVGRYQFQLITQKQRDFDIKLGGTASGRIDTPGRADAYAFQPPASGKLVLTGTFECGAGISYELVNLTKRQEERSPRSFCGDEPITVDNPGDRYAIVITHGKQGTAEYSFRLQAAQ